MCGLTIDDATIDDAAEISSLTNELTDKAILEVGLSIFPPCLRVDTKRAGASSDQGVMQATINLPEWKTPGLSLCFALIK